jgi:nucleoside-diphosphate-sugar epimerase
MSRLVIFGLGQSSRAFVERVGAQFSSIIATVRDPDRAKPMAGVEIMAFDGEGHDPRLTEAVLTADALLNSVPPDEMGDPVFDCFGDTIQAAQSLKWLGYLSTIGVYGDHQGAWVDETTPVEPSHERALRRIMAEQAWQALAEDAGLPLHIFRLAGIYGPAQSPLSQVLH